ncbi:MAG: 4-(cytidine 5'-diphospho)-2-C-methyl-D-erythritol kinase [Syntrophomonadaceae bacterium]
MAKTIVVNAPAKVNLTLDVKYKRPDGYHELETIMHQIDLCDRIILEPDREIILESNSAQIPGGKDNLAYRAAAAILEKYGIKEGVKIFLEKNIPVGAGLAGGSTDAAAVISGLNRLYDLGAGLDDLMPIAASLGSDVPFCLQGGTALATGRGEILEPVYPAHALTLVLVKPPFEVSTAQVYGRLDLTMVKNHPDARELLAAWEHNNLDSMALNMINVLENVTIDRFPEIGQIKKRLTDLGAAAVLMSGSGPSVFGLFENIGEAEAARDQMKNMYREVFLVSSYMGE